MPHPITPRAIIHLDLDAFYCAVEEQRDPALRGVPFAVGGRPDARGVVASCSYAARQFGVRSALPMARAVALCPTLVVVPPRFAAYREASQQVMAHLHALTPLVEQLSIDEAFVDVSALATDAPTLARQLQQTINTTLGLSCSLGVASNKLVAKTATDVGKLSRRTATSPNARCVVPPGDEAAFLAPLPVEALWGVGPKTAERLRLLGIRTIGDLARWPEADLVRRFGRHGAGLARHAWGRDERPVVTERVAKSVSKETTFAVDVRDRAVLEATVRQQAAHVAAALHRKQRHGTAVRFKLRWDDFTTITRQATLAAATGDAAPIADAALRLLDASWDAQRPVRLIGVGVGNLSDAVHQRSLWSDTSEREVPPALDAAIAALRTRFGSGVIDWGQPDPAD